MPLRQMGGYFVQSVNRTQIHSISANDRFDVQKPKQYVWPRWAIDAINAGDPYHEVERYVAIERRLLEESSRDQQV